MTGALGSEAGTQGGRRSCESVLEAARNLAATGLATTSSSQIGEPSSIKNAQARKDLTFFAQFGQPGVGYRIDELISTLRNTLGINRDEPVGLGQPWKPGPGPTEVRGLSFPPVSYRCGVRQ